METTAQCRVRTIEDDPLTGAIIGAAIEVHRILGPGALESAYQECLVYELAELRLEVNVQPILPFVYKNVKVERVFRPDIIVQRSVIAELKTVEKLLPVHQAQLLAYLKLSGLARGIVFNFNTPLLKDGIRRMNLTPSPSSPVTAIRER